MLARSLPIQGPCHRQQVRLAARRTAHRVPRLAATPPQAPDGLIDVETLRNLSPEARKVFQEAQANIMEINRGRIRALEELKLAKKRISELEGQLQEALQDVNQAAAQVAELKTVTESFATLDMPFVQEQPATAAAPDAAASAAGAPPFHAAAPAQAPAPPGQPQAPQEPSGVLIVYETSWNTAFLHFNADNKGWTNCPGNRMEEGRDQYSGKKVLKVPCTRLEFVANNGKDDWDHPDQFDSGGTKNYVVTTPGVYHLKGGKISKMA